MANVMKTFSLMVIAAGSLCPGVAAAQTYPTKPVRFIVPYAPGGAADVIGRIIASQLTQQLGEQIVVDNRAGASGSIGAEIAVRARPDGYTLLMYSTAHAINPSLYNLPYDPVKDLTPISVIAAGPSALVVHPGVPVNSVKDLIALAKRNPGKLDFASSGIGSFTHLSSELFGILAGIKIMIVPYRGVGAAMIDLIGGRMQASISTLSAFVSHIQAGKLRILGVGGSKRSVVLPDAPTIAEAGVPGYESSAWFGVAAPVGTPKAIVDRLNRELSVLAATAETKKQLLGQGAEVDYMGPADFGRYFKVEQAKWARVVKAGNIKMQ